jgi:hypothetical protein
MSNSRRKLTDLPEIGAYVLAHATGLAWGFGVNPSIFRALAAQGYRNLLLPSIALSIAIAAVVLLIFLVLRRIMEGTMQTTVDSLPAVPVPSLGPVPAVTQPLPAGAFGAGWTLGVISIVCGVIGLLPGIGILAAIIGIGLGWAGRRRALGEDDDRGAFLCRVGIILASVTLVIAALYLLLVGTAMLSVIHY